MDILSVDVLSNICIFLPTSEFIKISQLSKKFYKLLHSDIFLKEYAIINDLPILGLDDLFKDVTQPILRADIFMYPNPPNYKRKEIKRNPYIEIWATSTDCDNWSRHHHQSFNKFPDFFSFKCVYHKREGDQIKLIHDNKRIHLTLAQSKYRYRDRGTFHQLVNDYIQNYNLEITEEITDWIRSEDLTF